MLKMALAGLVLSVSGFANAGLITVAAIGANAGNQAANQIVTTDLGGSIDRISHIDFNSLSVADLISTYDVLLFTWATSSGLDADWATKIMPYLNAGGGVIWEDNSNVFSDLSSIVNGSTYASWLNPFLNSSRQISTNVTGLTDGLSIGDQVLGHEHFSLGPNTKGLYGSFGSGRMVITGPDLDYHALNDANAYKLLTNEINWVSSAASVPEPSTLAIFALGIMGLASRRFKKQ